MLMSEQTIFLRRRVSGRDYASVPDQSRLAVDFLTADPMTVSGCDLLDFL